MNNSEIENQFPAANREVYFNSAAVTLCPVSVKDQVAEFLDLYCRDNGAGYRLFHARFERLRENLAAMMRAASPDEIAVTHHTAEAVSVIANGLDWRDGDEILTLDKEYPSTIYPWRNLERRTGVRVAMLEEKDGKIDEDAIVEAIRRRRPRLFAVSAVEWCSGYRFDLEKIGAACEETGTFFFVDSAQALGFCEIDVRACRISAMAGSAWKWLFGPDGQGYLYLQKELLDRITPVFVGSESVVDHLDYLDYNLTFQPGMRRFEYSTMNPSAIVWFDAGVRFLLDLGLENVRSHVFDLQDYAMDLLKAAGCEIRGERPRPRRSGIIAFRHPAEESLALSDRLARDAGIMAKERDGFIRLVFHVYSTRQGVDKLLDLLA